MSKIPVLVIFAPTATGKTELLFRLFGKRQNREKGKSEFSPPLIPNAKIISADSMQVYRGMDICTAKPTAEERRRLEHFLLDIKNPDEQFSVAEFVERADALCEQLFSQGILPVVCGGTGFYIRSFLLGLPKTPEGNEKIREHLHSQAKELGSEKMWQRLFSVDRQSAQKINPKDTYRIVRALEIYELTGKPRTEFLGEQIPREKYDFTTLILERERSDLYNRIDLRVEKMFACGLESEVKALAQKYPPTSPGMKAIGCHEFFDCPPEEIKSSIKRNSKKYAKKQCFFMRGIPGAEIFRIPQDENSAEEVYAQIAQRAAAAAAVVQSVNGAPSLSHPPKSIGQPSFFSMPIAATLADAP